MKIWNHGEYCYFYVLDRYSAVRKCVKISRLVRCKCVRPYAFYEPQEKSSPAGEKKEDELNRYDPVFLAWGGEKRSFFPASYHLIR